MGKKTAQAIGITVLIIAAAFVVLMIIAVNSDSPTTNTATVTNAPQVTPGTSKVNDATSDPTEIDDNDIVLADDDYIKAVYEKRFDNDILNDVGYLMIKITNKSDQKLRVFTVNSSVNDEMLAHLNGGSWIDIEPQKSLRSTINIFFSTLDIKSVSDIKTIKFDLRVTDENMHEIESVENIQMDF